MEGPSNEASNQQLDKSEENVTDIDKRSVSLTDGVLRRGKCKWFNVSKGWGFITPDDGSQDVFVHQSVLEMAGFRSLGENEVVDFISKEIEKGAEATMVTGPNKTGLQGSKSRGKTRKHFRKMRCYNCGEFVNHKAADCTSAAQPKKCHYCKSSEHLMAQCPQAKSKNCVNEAST